MAVLNVSQAQAQDIVAQLVALGVEFSYRCTGDLGSAIAHRIELDDSRSQLLGHCRKITAERLARGSK